MWRGCGKYRRFAATRASLRTSWAARESRTGEHWIAVEKADWNQSEGRLVHRHHGPVFRPRVVGDAECVPEHDVGADE